MKFIKTKIPEVVILEPVIFQDDRGYFFESYNKEQFCHHVGDVDFIQDNQSKSVKGVLRGLHFQRPPFTQAKLIRCVEGTILDVVVDIRKGSPNYGQHVSVELSAENKKQLFAPRGFAHGFSVITETVTVIYKVDNKFSPKYDQGILYNDEDLAIDWGLNPEDVILSEKDKTLNTFKESNIPFLYE
tara:strand:+ start:349 stop:906 length:558 start_codon:yes stop_codon:yes gene_type:complete